MQTCDHDYVFLMFTGAFLVAIAATFGLSTLLNLILWLKRSEMIGPDAEQENIELSHSTHGPDGTTNMAFSEESKPKP